VKVQISFLKDMGRALKVNYMWLLAIKYLQIGVTRSAGLNFSTPIGQRVGVITREPYEEQP
jgi:hypothetical protein